jgi:hypothetical protein
MALRQTERPAAQLHRQCEWFWRLAVRVDVGVRRTTGAFVASHSNMDSLEIARILPWLRAENAGGGDIYVRPHRHAGAPMVFLDDVGTGDALCLAQQIQSLVVETSPNRCHVWLATDRALDEPARQRAQRSLALGQIIPGLTADAASTSGDHFGRLAGFRNRKPQRDCWVNLLAASADRPVLRIGDTTERRNDEDGRLSQNAQPTRAN